MNRYEMEPILNPAGRFVIYGDHLNAIEKLEARVVELEGVISKTIDAINSQSPKPRMSIHARAMLNKLRDTLTP